MVGLKVRVFALMLLLFMLLAMGLPAMALAESTEWVATPLHQIRNPDLTPAAVSGYGPSSIRAAYNLPSTGGSGTIALVNAYNDPNVASDLAAFSAQFNLPAANLQVYKMSSSISSNANWAVEISLDVEWAHAIAPNAALLLVEAKSSSLSDLLSAVNYARGRSDVVAISMSWGGSEFSTETAYDSYFTSQYGASFFASSGDTGGAIIWPSSSVNVISVGGTTLTQGTSGYLETAWSGSGGGVSAYEPKPAYQSSLTYLKRATPDVSYNADPNTGFAVYDSYGYSGWLVVGGTSCGAPQWAAIQALGKTVISSNIYAAYSSPTTYAADFRDIQSGTAGSYSAGTGYDLVTGVGSPLTTNFASAPTPDFSVSVSPSPVTINTGSTSSGSATITVTSSGSFSGQVGLIASTTSSLELGLSVTPVSVSTGSPGTSILSITVPSGTAAGTYPITVTGASGTLIHTITLNVQVTTPDFSLSANPSSLSIASGRQATTTITLSAINGYAGTVALSASAPSGITVSFSPTSVTATTKSTLTISVPTSTPRGTYTITITGTDTANAALNHQTSVKVTVTRR